MCSGRCPTSTPSGRLHPASHPAPTYLGGVLRRGGAAFAQRARPCAPRCRLGGQRDRAAAALTAAGVDPGARGDPSPSSSSPRSPLGPARRARRRLGFRPDPGGSTARVRVGPGRRPLCRGRRHTRGAAVTLPFEPAGARGTSLVTEPGDRTTRTTAARGAAGREGAGARQGQPAPRGGALRGDGYHELNTVYHAISTTTSDRAAGRHPHPDHGGGGRR